MECEVIMYVEELVDNISKEANLTFNEKEMLLHDINNLRAYEWAEIVEEHCAKKTIEEFNSLIGN